MNTIYYKVQSSNMKKIKMVFLKIESCVEMNNDEYYIKESI